MKFKHLLLALYTVSAVTGFAQRKTMTESNIHPYPFGNIATKWTYGYIVGEDGKSLKDGALSIRGTVPQTKVQTDYFTTITYSATYSVNALFSKGNLNGAITSSFSMPMTQTSRTQGTQTERATISFSGNFSEGIPNGTFVVKRNSEIKTNLTCTYKNGVLVGAFSCSTLFNDLPVTVKATLTANGKPTGMWTYERSGTNITAQFQNGVLITETISDQMLGKREVTSTKPALVALARKYAAKTITKEELAQQNIFVKTDYYSLGEYAETTIFRDSGVDFDMLGGYYFPGEKEITYEQLVEVFMLSDEGTELIKQEVLRYMDAFFAGTTDSYKYNILDISDLNAFMKEKSDNGTPYIKVKPEVTNVYKGVDPSYKYGDRTVYMTEAQDKEIRDAVNAKIKESAMTMKEYAMLECKYISKYKGNDPDLVKFLTDGTIADDYLLRDDGLEPYLEPLKENRGGERYDDDKNYQPWDVDTTIMRFGEVSHSNIFITEALVKKESIADYQQMLAELPQRWETLRKAKQTERINEALNYMLQQSSWYALFSNEENRALSNKYFASYDQLRDIYPIAGIELLEFDGKNVVIKVQKGSESLLSMFKKKPKIVATYQVTIPLKNSKLDMARKKQKTIQ